MGGPGQFCADALAIGIVATALMDIGGWLRTRLTGVSSLDYAHVGRWLAGLARGAYVHQTIVQAPPVRGEAILGWSAHYATGIAFAAALLALGGSPMPPLGSSLAAGLGTVAAPFFIIQPAFGFGVAACRATRPWVARVNSLLTHLIFGSGLYVGGQGWAMIKQVV